MVVIGGYNSSNTCNLAKICADRLPTYHIATPECIGDDARIRHRPIGAPSTADVGEVVTAGWLPSGEVRLGLTAGASTPDNIVGQVVERLERLAR
jgi:4-hydroxy-3-methylbut-2-enyl diphosphate reductase